MSNFLCGLRSSRGVGFAGVLLVAAAGLAMAQPGSGLPTPPRLPNVPSVPNAPAVPGLPGQPGGPGGQPGFNPQQLVDRLMQSDANGDGMLSRSEVPAQFAERNFDRFDTNADGLLNRAELDAGAANFGGGRGPGGGGGGRPNMDRAMHSIEDALHALEESAFDAGSMAADLGHVQTMQEGFLAAKFQLAGMVFSAEMLAHFEGDEAEARLEFREHLLDGLTLTIELETAIMEGDADAARATLAEMEELEEHSHREFRVD